MNRLHQLSLALDIYKSLFMIQQIRSCCPMRYRSLFSIDYQFAFQGKTPTDSSGRTFRILFDFEVVERQKRKKTVAHHRFMFRFYWRLNPQEKASCLQSRRKLDRGVRRWRTLWVAKIGYCSTKPLERFDLLRRRPIKPPDVSLFPSTQPRLPAAVSARLLSFFLSLTHSLGKKGRLGSLLISSTMLPLRHRKKNGDEEFHICGDPNRRSMSTYTTTLTRIYCCVLAGS